MPAPPSSANWCCASLLWRIRRATGIETDLLRIQAEILRERAHATQQEGGPESPPANPLYRAFRAVIPPRWAQEGNGSSEDEPRDDTNRVPAIDTLAENATDPARILTYCFLRLTHLDSGAFKRLNRYEAALWRQTVQTMAALRAIQYRYPESGLPISYFPTRVSTPNGVDSGSRRHVRIAIAM
jgi:hypothetical protein